MLSTRVCDQCSGPYVARVYLVRHGNTAATRLGSALWAVPSRDGQGVWMRTSRGDSRCAIRQVGLDGRPRRAARLVSCRTELVAELAAGLFVSFAGPGGSDTHSAPLKPDGGVVRFPDWQAQPVGGNLVLSGADRRTPLLLYNMHSGASHRLHWPARPDYSLRQVTGEPNGRRAIVDYATYSPEHRLDLWLLDTASRRWRHLPGMPAHLIPKVTDVKWTPDGRVVILSSNVLAVWRPGEPRLAVRRVKPSKHPGTRFVIW